MKTFKITAVFLMAAMLSGCASNYKLGTTLPKELRDVYVPSVKNESGEPMIDLSATPTVLREVRREGTLSITDESRAVTRLDVTIKSFEMKPVRYSSTSADKPQEYRATIKADVIFRRRDTGAVLFTGEVTGDETFEDTGDLVSAKQRVVPEALEDLSEDIVDRCISVW